jgi:hypothetical protein
MIALLFIDLGSSTSTHSEANSFERAGAFAEVSRWALF